MRPILQMLWLTVIVFAIGGPSQGDPLTLAAGEYFFDTDPGLGMGLPLTMNPDSQVVIYTDLDAAGLGDGLHTLYVRFLDSRGIWSPARGKGFRIGPVSLLSDAEHFLDADPGAGSGSSIEVADSSEHVFVADLSLPAAPCGLHTFYVRYKTSDGLWSQSRGKALRVTDPTGSILTGGEFFLDTDPGFGQGISLHSEDGAFDGADETMYRIIRADTLRLGHCAVYIRVRSGDAWSYTLADSILIGGDEVLRLVSYRADTVAAALRLTWPHLGATEYRVHYDSVSTGPFTDYYIVAEPETSLVLPVVPDEARRFYYVIASWPEAVTATPGSSATMRSGAVSK